MIDHNLLRNARAATAQGITKEAFNPMTPEAAAAAAAQGGAPPMDPAMAGGAPPMDPAMAAMGGAPMDPAMMGAPPMDPAMMDPAMAGGAPMDPAMMDPAMMGGAPPMEDPAAGTPVTLTLEDLQQVVKEMGGGAEENPEEPKRATNTQIMEELQLLKDSLAALAAASGVQLPAGDVGVGGDTAATAATAAPEELAAVAGEIGAMGGEDPMSQALSMGLPPGEMPPEAMPKVAVDKFISTKIGSQLT